MIKGRDIVAELRRDASFIVRLFIAIVFVGFAGMALAATLLDLWSIRP